MSTFICTIVLSPVTLTVWKYFPDSVSNCTFAASAQFDKLRYRIYNILYFYRDIGKGQYIVEIFWIVMDKHFQPVFFRCFQKLFEPGYLF